MLNPGELSEAFSKNNVLVLSVSKEIFRDVLADAAGFLSSKFNKICYVSLSKPYKTVVGILESNKVKTSKFFFIDVLTSAVSTPAETDNCVFIDSPSDLTSIGLAISEALKFGCDAVFVDSLTTLLVYNEVSDVIKFSNSVLTKMGVIGKKALLVTLKEDENNELVKDLYEFADKVIKV